MSDNNQGVKPEYSVVLEGVNAKAGITSATFKEAATRRFGDAIMTASFSAGFPFDSPRECIFAASKHNGKEPLQTVATSDLLKDEQALLSQADLQQWVRTKKWQTSATLKAVAWATLQQHHRPGARTMTSCTPSELVSSLMADDETWTTEQQPLSERQMSHVFSLFDGSDGKVSRSVVLFMLQLLLRSIDGDEGNGWDEDSDENEGEGDGERDGGDGGESDEGEQSGDNDESTDGAENSDENSESSDAGDGEDDDDSGGEFD